MTDVLNQVRAALAEELGVGAGAEEGIKERTIDWDVLLQQGVIVGLHIRRYRAATRLTREDLGLRVETDGEQAWWDEFLSLGEKYLLPHKYIKGFNSLESSGRGLLARLGYDTPFGTFVPVTAFRAFRERLEAYRVEYLALGREVAEKYEELQEETVASYRVGAWVAYRRLQHFTEAGPLPGEAEFIDNFITALRAAMPTQETVAASYEYEMGLAYCPLPSQLEADFRERDRIRAERDTDFAATKLENVALAERRRLLDEMNEQVVAQARAKKEQKVDQFIEKVVGGLHSRAYKVAVDALESIKKNNGKLIGKSADGLRGLLETVGQMSFYADADMDAKMAELERLLGENPEQRSVEAIEASLRELATLSRFTLLQVGEQPRSARSVGVPDVVPVQAVREARQRLGVASGADLLTARRQQRSIG